MKFQVSDEKINDQNHVLKYFRTWKKIEKLSDLSFSLDENEEEITSLEITYNLLIKYTSFVAVFDKIRNTEESAKDVKKPLPMPKVVTNLAVSQQSMGSMSEPELYLLFILAGLLLSSALYKFGFKRFYKQKK